MGTLLLAAFREEQATTQVSVWLIYSRSSLSMKSWQHARCRARADNKLAITPAWLVQVTFKGQGPLGELQAIATAEGQVKGKVQAPDADPPLNAAGKLNVGAGVGAGCLAVVRNHPMQAQPYTGTLTVSVNASAFAPGWPETIWACWLAWHEGSGAGCMCALCM